jgi:hypothetical protein
MTDRRRGTCDSCGQRRLLTATTMSSGAAELVVDLCCECLPIQAIIVRAEGAEVYVV